MVNEVKTDEIHVRYLPATKWWKDPEWELLKEYTSANGEVTAPVGFVTDGATIPFFVRGYFKPTGRYFGAAIVHDFVIDSCPQPTSKEDWAEGNKQFKAELEALKIQEWRLSILMAGVRAWAWTRVNIVDPIQKFFSK